jgi:hypothetical protein
MQQTFEFQMKEMSVAEMLKKTGFILLFVLIWLAVICSFFAGCMFSKEEQEAVIASDMYTSREGVLSNGRKFIFHGADQVTVTLEEFLEELRLTHRITFDFIIQEETVEEIFEKLQLESDLWLSRLEPDKVYIIAHYLPESKDISFSIAPFEGVIAGFPPVWVINHESGIVSEYGTILLNSK